MNKFAHRVHYLGLFGALALAIPAVAAASRLPVDRAQVAPSKDKLKLAFRGDRGAIPYEKFGHFDGVGTAQYKYVITDREGLEKAVGEGIYPNTDVYKDPTYKQLAKDGKLRDNQWNYVDTPTCALNFYRWAVAAEDPGVKQYYIAVMLERLGLFEKAAKAYYAVAVHFPKSVGYTYFHTPWYMGPSALDRLEEILRHHPELHLRWTGGSIIIPGKFGLTPAKGEYIVDPGKLVNDPKGQWEPPVDLTQEKVIKTVGGPKVQLKEYANHHWQLFVDGQPFIIRGLTYSMTPIGASPDRGTWDVSKDWQLVDTNKNGIHDGFFESHVTGNGGSEAKVIGDARLIKDLGVNTLRAYHHIYNHELFRKLYKEYGFYVLCGDVLGGYTVGSGARWKEGTDYRNPAQKKRMLEGVRQMVEENKDEPYILMWVLGNENVYGVGNNSQKDPEAFYELVDQAAQLIHKLDPTRPVAIANGDVLFLDILKKKAPHLDVIGMNVYRGEQGFGRHLFLDVQTFLDKPAMVTEYGAPAYAEDYPQSVAEAYQAMYLTNNWEDLSAHVAGHGVGNAIGGVLFEWMDEWWKANSDLPLSVQREHPAWYAKRSAAYKNLQPTTHDTVPQFGGPFLDGWSYEEWFGITRFPDSKDFFGRVLRPAYHSLKQLWNPS